MRPYNIGGINRLPLQEKRDTYIRLVPPTLWERFKLNPYLMDEQGRDLVNMKCEPGTTSVEIEVRHEYGFPDPLLYGHLMDTINGQIHILLYVINNPDSPRFNIDRLADGTPTNFGIFHRNLEAEEEAMAAGLAPGQIRSGLRILSEAVKTFATFIEGLGHDMYFIEPLFYHNAIVFERHGFTYQSGRRRMKKIQKGFAPGGKFEALLDDSTTFRKPIARNSIRLRSWAIHDGIMGEPLHDIVMYKVLGKSFQVNTAPGIPWDPA
jgi:hypothetical protein